MSTNIISACLLLAAAAAGALADDKSATALKVELTYSSQVVQAGSSFSASVTASDPSGVDRVTFSASPPGGWWYPCQESKQFTLVNGTAFDGTWMIECHIGADTPSQTYAFTYNAYDTAGNTAGDYVRKGFKVLGGPEAEYNPPIIEKVTCSDTVSAGTPLDIYLQLADESGIGSSSYVNLHQTDGNVHFGTADFVLDSGSSTDGVWKASTMVDTDTPNGEYWFEIHVYDTQKNPAELNMDDGVVVVGGAVPDHTKPTIVDVTYADTTVEKGQTLYLTATISDLQTGIDYVNFDSKESYSQAQCCKGPMTLKSGDMTSGVWEFSCVVPSDVDIAYYSGAIYAFDNQNNEGYSTSSFQVVL